MAVKEPRGETEQIKKLNSISILDFVEKEGYEVIDVDEKTATLANYEDILINRESNSWRVQDTDEHGNTIRFVARMRDIDWKEAIKYLKESKEKYKTLEQYNLENPIRHEDKEIKVKEQEKIETDTEKVETMKEKKMAPKDKKSEDIVSEKANEADEKTKNVRNGIEKDKQNRTYSQNQMKEILSGIKKGVDTKIYNDIELNSSQMKEIRLGLEEGLDVKQYNYSHLSAAQMKEVRLGLQKGVTVNLYQKDSAFQKVFTANQLKEIRKGLEKNLNVNLYANQQLSAEQMKQVRLGLQDKMDVSSYANPHFSAEQMCSVRRQILVKKIAEHIQEVFKDLWETLYHKLQSVFSRQNSNLAEDKEVNIIEVNNKVDEKINQIVSEIVDSIEENAVDQEIPYDEKIKVVAKSFENLKTQLDSVQETLTKLNNDLQRKEEIEKFSEEVVVEEIDLEMEAEQ